MVAALWIIVALLTIIVVLLAGVNMKFDNAAVSVRDFHAGELAEVSERRLLVRSSSTQFSAIKSEEGKLVAYGTGLLELQEDFDGSVIFFRNDNPDSMNFYVDFIFYSWHPHLRGNPRVVCSIVYDSTEPKEDVFVPSSMIMNQNFPDAAKDNGVFVLAWKGKQIGGMLGSSGGRGVTIFTLQPEFRQIPLEGKIIVGPEGTQRFDVKTEEPGALCIGAVGWFAHSF